MAHYLASIALESGGFTRQTENLNYTSAQRIYDVFKGSSKNHRFKSVAECQPYVRNPEKLANKVYGNRMGNTKPGNGRLYRGRTPKQITGKANYAANPAATVAVIQLDRPASERIEGNDAFTPMRLYVGSIDTQLMVQPHWPQK
ncbi:putative chitinase [Phyllobacterium ifriqiyense]|uniref:Chitinase n=1 Tax=Phyllobacterium ifriqiyense TaxID=314238 RepID=A0ABU0S363_9HYPH|nr:hypothetical protein [Phyllobacterium ifriqiyense]MDQ0995197.1 putative chitinase [Phyllobacterium ifriqiyense]